MNNKEKQQEILKEIEGERFWAKQNPKLGVKPTILQACLKTIGKAKAHKEEVKEELGNLKCVFKNDRARLECAKIIKKYEENGI